MVADSSALAASGTCSNRRAPHPSCASRLKTLNSNPTSIPTQVSMNGSKASPSLLVRLATSWRGKLGGLGLMTLLLTLANPANALEIRVAIEESARAVQVGASTNAIVKTAAGEPLGQLKAMGGNDAQVSRGQVSLGPWSAGQVWVEPTDGGLVWIDGSWYRGRVLLTPTGNGLTAVNYVDLEEYLYSVVASEMPTSWHLEALKAQAVAARSYAVNKHQRTATALYDVKDTTSSQVYRGVAAETDSTRKAVKGTDSKVLTYGGKVIEAVFHSSSGGHTENSEHVWSSPLPYLKGVPDFDQDAPVFQWNKQFSASQLRSKLTAKFGQDIKGIGNIVAIAPVVASPHGRIKTLSLQGDRGSKTVKAAHVRQALGLRSTLFTAEAYGSAKASDTTFVFQGRGYGHGIGMSQYGARGMAEQGNSFEQILGHYYRNAYLSEVD